MAEMTYKDRLKLDLFPTIWCPGCGIGTIMMMLAMTLDEMKLDERNTIIVTGIGCTGRMGGYLKHEAVYTLHGRTLPVAEAIKTVRPEMNVIVVAGDGDTASHRRQPPDPLDPPQRAGHRAVQQQRDLRPDRRPDRADHADRHQDALLAGRQPEHADQPAGPGPLLAARAVREDDGLPPAPPAERDPRGDRVARLQLRRHHQPVHREQRAAHRLRQRERHAHLLPQDLQARAEGRDAAQRVRDRHRLPGRSTPSRNGHGADRCAAPGGAAGAAGRTDGLRHRVARRGRRYRTGGGNGGRRAATDDEKARAGPSRRSARSSWRSSRPR